jgi:putative glutamine amidotransferase
MNHPRHPPLVLLPACHWIIDGRDFHATPAAYSEALRLAGCLPSLVSAESPGELAALLEIADGVLRPGSPNNVHPAHFGEAIHDPSLPLDPRRDALSLPLIREAIARGIPLLGICRGHQEINVALGGSLHQAVHEVPGHDNHQPAGDEPPEQRFGPVHPIRIVAGGLLERLLGSGPVIVNSVHGQAVHRLAPGLRIEALAPDGVIEAIHAPDAPGFNLGVQWHPEWKAAGNPVSVALFQAFGDACRTYRDHRASDHPRA